MAAEAMDALADRYAHRGVTSAFLYTREAHPGENYRHHRSMDDKRRRARALRDEAGVRRTILLDDLAGTAHHAYGLLPNMTWIVGKRGVILYKSAWTWSEDVEHALEHALDQLSRRRDERLVPFFSQRLGWRGNDPGAFRAGLERAGPQAVKDFYGDK
jgi:hypothetical protein